MPNKARIIQKEWAVLTKPFIEYNDSAVTVNNVSVKHPCQDSRSNCPQYAPVTNGDKAWVEYGRATSFTEIRYMVRELLYEVGLKKDEIQVVELVNHDYIVTPLT